jgi:hypothetical protein
MREERPATAGNSWIPLRDGQQQVARMQRQRNAGKMLGHGVDPRIPLRYIRATHFIVEMTCAEVPMNTIVIATTEIP